MKKPRPTKALLSKLPPEQIDAIYKMLAVEKLIYREAIQQAKERFGLNLNRTSLCRFFQKICVPRMQAEREKRTPIQNSSLKFNISIEIFQNGEIPKVIITAPDPS